MYASIRRFLSRPNASRWIVALSALLCATSLTSGLAADDFIHEMSVGGASPIEGFRHTGFDLFRFASPRTVPGMIRDAVLPWWADPQVQFGFLRPLAALTHWVDHKLFPGNAFLMHAHTLAWHVLSVIAAGALYRRIGRSGDDPAAEGTSWVPVLALALYALDDVRGGPVAWVANRNELVACAISLAAVVLHHDGTEGNRRARLLAPLTLGVALLAGEGAIAVTAYLFAHALFLESGPLEKRLGELWPYAAVIVVWRAIYHFLGYGIARSGVYFDPVSSPAGYFRFLPERFSMLWLSQLGGPWSEGWNAYSVMFPGVEVAVVILAVVVIALNAAFFTPLLRTSATARFWLLGGVIATLPACGAFPADRLLPWVSVGGMGITAEFFASVVEGRRKSLLARAGAALIVFTHIIMALVFLPIRSAGIAQVRAAIERGDRGIPSDPGVRSKTVVLMNPPGDPFASYVTITRAAEGVPRPGHMLWLVTGAGTDVHVERVDERTLDVRPKAGLLTLPSERLFRDLRLAPFHAGDSVSVSGAEITVTEVDPGGRPLAIRARFEAPLEDPRYVFLAWVGGTYVPFDVPGNGTAVTIPPVDLVKVAYGPDNPVTKALGRN